MGIVSKLGKFLPRDIIEQRTNLRDRFNLEADDLALPSSADVITREGG